MTGKATYTTDGNSTRFRLPEADFGDDRTSQNDGYICGHIKITMVDGSVVESDIYTSDDHGSRYAYMDFGKISGSQVGNPDYTDIQMTGNLDFNTKMVMVEFSAKVPVDDAGGIMEDHHLALPRVCSNNIEITAFRGREHDEKQCTICKMTRCVWYGGSRSGLAGGTRLFVCGNPDEPNLLHWSGLEHPLYFPEHNYNRIGDASQAITAFGKQGELLIVFKERQMYALQYDAGDETDYAIAEQGGVPFTTYAAQFPVTPINSAIGCDCPDTVRMVNNRLVWANSNGHVYMLTATNQFSERNARDISRNITTDMVVNGALLKTAIAGEYEGYYILAAGKRVYLLDTQNSAFSSFNYYSSEDNARKALPWYIWTLPVSVYGMVSDGQHVVFASEEQDSYLYRFADGCEGRDVYAKDSDSDTASVIHGHFATKMFDFGLVDRTKSVGQMYMGMEMAADGRLALTYISEKGNRHDPYEIDGGDMAEFHGEGCMRYMRFTPHMHLVQTFGFRADVTSTVAVDGISIKVKQQGVVR